MHQGEAISPLFPEQGLYRYMCQARWKRHLKDLMSWMIMTVTYYSSNISLLLVGHSDWRSDMPCPGQMEEPFKRFDVMDDHDCDILFH